MLHVDTDVTDLVSHTLPRCQTRKQSGLSIRKKAEDTTVSLSDFWPGWGF